MPLHVSVQNIQRMHPKGMESSTDFYYAKIGNQLLKSIQRTGAVKVFGNEVLEIMAIKVVLYFEDIICDGGIWRSFVNKHRELYGKTLPFYPVDEKDYQADEPHVEDIRYLLWEVVMDCYQDVMINPQDKLLAEIAKIFYDVLDAEFEKAPINEGMQRFFQEATFMADFIEMREMLGWLWMDCYLTEGHKKFDVAEEMIDEVCDVLHFDNHDPRAIYAALSQMVFRYQCGPLALFPAEWLALLMETVGNHAYADMLRNIDYRKYEVYLLENFDTQTIHLKNTKDEEFVISMDGYGDMSPETLCNTEGCVASFVRYNGRWEPNGMDSWGNFRQAYEDIKERQKRYGVGLPPKNYKLLMKESGGSPLFYFRNGKEVREFMIKGVGIPETMMRPSDMDDKEFIIAFVPSANESVAFAYGVANCVKDARNPYYGMKYHDDDAMMLISDTEICDPAMLRYLIQHHMLPDASFNDDPEDKESLQLAQDNLDFIARTVRRHLY